MHVDNPLVAEEVEAPHVLEQLAAGEHAPRRAGQRDEQIELERAERDRSTVPFDLASADVDDESVEDQPVGGVECRTARGSGAARS